MPLSIGTFNLTLRDERGSLILLVCVVRVSGTVADNRNKVLGIRTVVTDKSYALFHYTLIRLEQLRHKSSKFFLNYKIIRMAAIKVLSS